MKALAAAVLAALAATAVASAAAAAAIPRESAEACHAATQALEAKDPDREHALAEIEACRAFVDAFARVSDGPVPVSADGVRDALVLFDEGRHGPPARVADPAAVAPILAGIQQERDRPPETMWQRFVHWVMERFTRQAPESHGMPGWLRWLSGIPPEVLRAIWWSLFAILALSLAWIVIRELRAAGAFSRGKRERRRPVAAAEGDATAGRAPTLAEVAAMPDALQAGALLRAAIAHLRLRQRLPADDSLTNGELRAQLSGISTDERTLFGEIVRVADAQLYGGVPPQADRLRTLIEAAGAAGLAR